MSEKVERELRALFAEAEARGACATPSEKRLQVACLRRTGETGTVVSSARGLFVRRSWWEGLGFSEQTLAIMRAVQRRHPDWVFCGPSAALALGCDVPYAWQRPLHVLRESGNASARTALVTHHSTTLADDARERPIWRRRSPTVSAHWSAPVPGARISFRGALSKSRGLAFRWTIRFM